MSIGRQDYEDRKEKKIATYKERAIKASKTAHQEFTRAREMGSVIPFGQPIGHHSKGSHRALLKRIDTTQRKASATYAKTAYYENRAETAETNHSISDDDPEAADRYQAKLEKTFQIGANRLLRCRIYNFKQK